MAAGRFRSSSQPDSPSGGRTAFRLRPVAIGLMIAGVIGFIAARVVFGDQVLCLLGSTLVTFAGLALIIAARRLGWGSAARAPLREQQGTVQDRLDPGRGQVPMGDSTGQAWMEAQAQRQSALPPLAEHAAAIFRQQGAKVAVEAQQAGRVILQVETNLGERYTAMVLEDSVPADAADVRGLYALVASSHMDGGLLINSAGFTPRALQWAEGKPLRLVEASGLSDLNI